jgi:RNA polymerase sigma factor (sigma-70 family)
MPPPTARALAGLRRLAAASPAAGPADAHLLERFVSHRDEAAFELLVRRHGPRVWAVCRRVLGQPADAEDAFQATFLLLVRRAGSVRRSGSLGGWLGRVAYRVALRARADAHRRGLREHQAARPDAAGPCPPEEVARRELAPVLAEEVQALPEPYRRPVVLCYLEGRTNGEAARMLQWPVGTLKTRLARARELLGRRLLRRGVALAAGWSAAPVELPAALVGSTVRLVGRFLASPAEVGPVRSVLLSEGVANAMTALKLKVAAVLVLALAGGGVGMWSLRADDRPVTPPAKSSDLDAAKARVAEARDRLAQAEREVARLEAEPRPAPPPDSPVATIFGDTTLTRADFAEFLLRRAGADKLKLFVNREIIETAAHRRGITVTPQEIDAAFQREILANGPNYNSMAVEGVVEPWPSGPFNYLGPGAKSINPPQEELDRAARLKPFGKTPTEWKEDVIRPRLLLEKLAGERIRATEEEVRQAFVNRFGERAECKLILVKRERGRAQAEALYQEVRTSDQAFEMAARTQEDLSYVCLSSTPQTVGKYSYFPANLERAALQLRVGEVSPPVEIPDGYVIIKCIRRIQPDRSRTLALERAELEKDIRRTKINQVFPKLFQELRDQARPQLLLKP